MKRWLLACGCALSLACAGGSESGDPGGGADVPATDLPDHVPAIDVAGDPDQPPQDTGGTTDPGLGEETGGGADAPAADVAGDPGQPPQDTGGTTDIGPVGVTYEPPDPSTTFTYLLQACGENPPQEVPANIAGTEEIGGSTWRRLEVGDFKAPTRNGFVSFSRIRDGRYEVIGSDVYEEGQEAPVLSWRFDQPIGGPISGQDGLTGTTSTTGTFCVTNNCDSYNISVKYTLVSTSETIDVAYGTVHDCIHIRFEQSSSDMGDYVLESNWWVKSGIGLVKATEIPGYCGLELKAVHH